MLQNWASATTTTTGTGALTLAAVSGWPTPNAVVGLNRQFRYAILDDATGAPLASGIGSLSGATTLVRGATETTFTGGTYTQAGSPLSLAAGTKRVIVTALAEDLMPAIPGVQNISGSKIVLPDGLSPAANTKGLTSNVAVLSCLRWSCARQITALACGISTASGTASDRLQLGIYSCGADGLPGVLVARTVDIAPNTTGFKTASLAGGSTILPAGWYWFACASNVTPTVTAYNAGGSTAAVLATPMGHAASSVNNRIGFFGANLTNGWTALPDTLSLFGGTPIGSDFPPTVGAVLA